MSNGYKMTELGEIPKSWEVVTLEEITLPKSGLKRGPFGGALKKEFFVESGYKVYEQKHAIYKDLTIGNYYIDDVKFEEMRGFAVEPGDLIVSCSGTIGRIVEIPDDAEPGVINQALLRIRINPLKADRSFFFHLFESEPIQNKIIDGTQGGAMKNLVGMNEFRKTSLLLPPLPEQRKIAEILSTVDEKLHVVEAQITQTQELKRGLLQRLLTKGIGHTQFKDSPLGEIPESWDVVRLGEHVEKVGSGITPRGGHEAYVKNGVLFLRSQNVLRGKLNLTDVAYIPAEQHDKMSGSKVRRGDVLLNITGASIGRSCIVPPSVQEANVNQHVCIIRPTEAISSIFLSQWLNCEFGVKQIEKFQAGGNREGLNYQQIRSFTIPLPSHSEQTKIAAILLDVDNKIDVLNDKKSGYQVLKKGLMQQLLTGKIRVNQTNQQYEPTQSRRLQAVVEG